VTRAVNIAVLQLLQQVLHVVYMQYLKAILFDIKYIFIMKMLFNYAKNLFILLFDGVKETERKITRQHD